MLTQVRIGFVCAKKQRFTLSTKLPIALLCASAAALAAEPVRVPVEWLACDDGKYAVTLPRHYPSLRNIGKHRITVLGTRGTLTLQRLQFIGMRVDVLLHPEEPHRYRLVELESTSRRWNIGRFSVGTRPWIWWPEKELKDLRLHGPIELIGRNDHVAVEFNNERVVTVSYRCAAGSR